MKKIKALALEQSSCESFAVFSRQICLSAQTNKQQLSSPKWIIFDMYRHHYSPEYVPRFVLCY